MLIGVESFCDSIFEPPYAPFISVKYVEIKNTIIDELHIQSIVADNSTKENWTNGTILLAKYAGDLEAGNIVMRENPITKLRIKRRNTSKASFTTLKELPFDPEPTELTFDDYTASSNREYEYLVTPVDETGIEGVVTAVSAKPEFEGWWIIDRDNPEENNFRFLYNLDDVHINTDEDRSELRTFGKYPMVRYGELRAKKGTLTGLIIPEELDARQQVEKLDRILQQHKPLLLKGSRGQSFIVDVSAPSETIMSRINGLSRVQLNWMEVDAYID